MFVGDHKDTWHQHTWYWPRYPRIFQFQYHEGQFEFNQILYCHNISCRTLHLRQQTALTGLHTHVNFQAKTFPLVCWDHLVTFFSWQGMSSISQIYIQLARWFKGTFLPHSGYVTWKKFYSPINQFPLAKCTHLRMKQKQQYYNEAIIL